LSTGLFLRDYVLPKCRFLQTLGFRVFTKKQVFDATYCPNGNFQPSKFDLPNQNAKRLMPLSKFMIEVHIHTVNASDNAKPAVFKFPVMPKAGDLLEWGEDKAIEVVKVWFRPEKNKTMSVHLSISLEHEINL